MASQGGCEFIGRWKMCHKHTSWYPNKQFVHVVGYIILGFRLRSSNITPQCAGNILGRFTMTTTCKGAINTLIFSTKCDHEVVGSINIISLISTKAHKRSQSIPHFYGNEWYIKLHDNFSSQYWIQPYCSVAKFVVSFIVSVSVNPTIIRHIWYKNNHWLNRYRF